MPIKFYTTVAKYEPAPEPVIPFDLTEPFYVALLDGATSATVRLTAKGDEMMGEEPPVLTVETSTDKTNWTTQGDTYVDCNFSIPLSTSQPKVYIRAAGKYGYQYTTWGGGMATNYFTGNRVKIGGNIASLAYGSHFTGYENTVPFTCFNPEVFTFSRGATIDNLIFPMDGESNAYDQIFNFITFASTDTVAYVLSGTGENTVNTGFTPPYLPYGTTATVYIPKGLTTVYQYYYASNSTLIEYNRPTGE